MIREAELFVQSEQVLVEVIGRVRGEQWDIVLPPLLDAPDADQPVSLREAVARYAHEDARLAERTAGGAGPDRPDEEDDLLGDDPHAAVTRLSAAACAAARKIDDGDAAVREQLWRLSIVRAFLAHEIAMQLGSRACPLTEEQARGLWEGTAPDAEHWRSVGVFRDPLPMPDDVSWRDRFLLATGRDPHALEDRV